MAGASPTQPKIAPEGHVTEAPPRPSVEEVEAELAAHIRTLAGDDAVPRPEQVAAVSAVVAESRRTLLVARTGFGKSAVYFSATRMLRDRGWGPTIVVSPLLALMRDQVASASRLGLVAETINSSNLDAWDDIEARIAADEVDLLLIAPERLANPGFRERVFALLLSRPIALVCDEAHCISDWGHDFRPDYLRLRAVLDELAPWTPVLATTATANQRVTDDVAGQLGSDTLVLRTSLDRASLHLSVVDLADDAERMAWLDAALDRFDGSGIVYCLTVDQAERTAAWLADRGRAVAAYTGQTDPGDREALEDALRENRLKALVATSALGMGFDKGDLAFCVHLGLPPTPVAYYQQIGRAGRAVDHAEVVALPRGHEDERIWRWFESVSLPPESTCHEVLDQLDRKRSTSVARLEPTVNLGRSRLSTLLSILDVQGAVRKVDRGWIRSDEHWAYDGELAARLTELRRDEAAQMRAFVSGDGCRLRFLRDRLDDPEAVDCGRCDRCSPGRWDLDLDPEAVESARRTLRGGDVLIEPRRQWPTGLDEPKGKIKADRQANLGRALCRIGDGGWSPAVERLLSSADDPDGEIALDDQLVRAVAGVLKRWDWAARPTWICPMPSRRRGPVIDALATALGELGKLPVHRALRHDGSGGWQADQANSAHQLSNVWGRLSVVTSELPERPVLDGPVLLVDDEADSRWTLTVATYLLTGADTGPVLPFVLRTR
ncbi:MAG: helicase-related protein [Actinomycetota bacterium]|nr:helicase-related protein [Actinomycetota bacterium]